MLHQVRRPDGRRKIVQIAELDGYGPDGPQLNNIFTWNPDTQAFTATGRVPRVLAKMGTYGAGVPADIFNVGPPGNGSRRRKRARLEAIPATE
jgi:hypothetical protein